MDENQETEETSHENSENEPNQSALEDHFSRKGYECKIMFLKCNFLKIFSHSSSFILGLLHFLL